MALADFLIWSYQVATQEDGGAVRTAARLVTAPRRLRRPLRTLRSRRPAPRSSRTAPPGISGGSATPDMAHPQWAPSRLGHALQRVRTPVLLVTGWQDVFLTQTFDQLHGSCATAAPSRS